MSDKVNNTAIILLSVAVIVLIIFLVSKLPACTKMKNIPLPSAEFIEESSDEDSNVVILLKKDEYLPLKQNVAVYVDDYICLDSKNMNTAFIMESNLKLDTDDEHYIQTYVDGVKSARLKFNITDEKQWIVIEYYDQIEISISQEMPLYD